MFDRAAPAALAPDTLAPDTLAPASPAPASPAPASPAPDTPAPDAAVPDGGARLPQSAIARAAVPTPAPVAPERRVQLKREVAIGQGGFLFHRFGHAFEQLCSGTIGDDTQLRRWSALIETRRAWCAAQGIANLMLIVPERHAIYADRLPEGYMLSRSRPVERLRRLLDPALGHGLVYPDAALMAAREAGEVFYRTDLHMTFFGAYWCYRALHAAIAAELPPGRLGAPLELDALQRQPSRLLGELGIRLDDEEGEEIELLSVPGREVVRKIFSNGNAGKGHVDVYQNDDASLPRVVIFGDSHTASLLPYLGTHFSRLVVVQSWRFFHELVREERPDVVLCQISETQIAEPVAIGKLTIRLPDDFEPTGFAEYCGRDLPPPPPPPSPPIVFAAPAAAPLFSLDFGATGESAAVRRSGWSAQEPLQVWTLGSVSTLEIPAQPPRAAYVLTLELSPLIIPSVREAQRLTVRIGDTVIGVAALQSDQVVSFDIPADLPPQGDTWRITLHHPDAIAPSSTGHAQDDRPLALAIRRLEIRPG